jgi:cation transport ATPase
MMAETQDSGLHEYVDAGFVVDGLESPASEKELRDKLGKLNGVKDLSILRDKVTVRYEPATVSEKAIEAIRNAGLQIREAQGTQSSPLTNALTEQQKQH